VAAAGTGAVLPAAHSLADPAALRALLAAEYDLGPVRACRLWHNGVTETHRVEAERGRYFLRLYRAGWRSDAEVAYEMDALAHLAGKGVPLAGPILRRDGTRFGAVRAPEGRRLLALFAGAPGRVAWDEPGFSARFGAGLAALHAAGDDFRSPHPRRAIDLDVLLDRPLARLEPLVATHPADRAYLHRLAARVRRGVEALAVRGLDWGLCHGDAFGGNCLLDGPVPSGRLTHFDFDDCGPGWRAYDLASYRWILAWRAPGQAAARWRECLRGYRAVRPLGATDAAAVSFFVAAREVWVLGQNARAMLALRGLWLVDLAPRLRFLRGWAPRLRGAGHTP
jgi:Ser/Thr protein kinase RdoA (MazF antagonist)